MHSFQIMFQGAFRAQAHLKQARNLSCLNHVTGLTVEHLRQHGYAVQDQVLPSQIMNSLLQETHDLIRVGFASPNKTHIVSENGSKTYEKSTVLQAEVHTLPESYFHHIPSLSSLQNDSSLCAMLSVLWPRLTLRDQSVKIQRSSGKGACFPIHIDTSPSRDSRIITALLYPHESWSSREGALRIYKSPTSFTDVQPLPGRLVLLASALMHHRVMPADRDRYAITVWLSGKLRPPSVQLPALLSVSALAAYHLLTPTLRDMSFRIALENEWISSLRESHKADLADELVDDFRRNLTAIRRLLPGILQKREGLEECALTDIQKILSSSEALKAAYHELEDTCGDVPFLW